MYTSEAAYYILGEDIFIETAEAAREVIILAQKGEMPMTQKDYNIIARDCEIADMVVMRQAELLGITNRQIV